MIMLRVETSGGLQEWTRDVEKLRPGDTCVVVDVGEKEVAPLLGCGCVACQVVRKTQSGEEK